MSMISRRSAQRAHAGSAGRRGTRRGDPMNVRRPRFPHITLPARLRTRWARLLLALAVVAAMAVTAVSVTAGTGKDSGRHDADRTGQDRDKDAQGSEPGEESDEGQEGEDEDDGGPVAPAEYLTQKFTSGQNVSQAQIEHAIDQARALPTGGGTWSLVGPSNVGGRMTDLVVDPHHADTLYVAASGGGVWKSTDAGATFQAVWPTEFTQTLGALAMGSDGNLSGTAGQRGIYRLVGPGQNWQQVLPTPNNTTGGIDLAIDPSDHNRVFATLWDHKRNNGARVYGGVGSGLVRSGDGGDTWTRLENVTGVATTDAAGTGLTSDASLGRIGVAIAPGDPNRVYVVSGTQYGLDKGFYVSNDGGDTFTPSGHAGGNSGYEWWFGRLWVDPANKDHVFNADVNLRESNDGGATWHTSSGVHADQHAMQWDPNSAHRVYVGNDGGIYRSESDGSTGSWVHATYEPFNQSYHLAVAADDPSRLATGLQDNGSVRTWTATAPPSDLTQWNAYGGGDGHEVLIDPTDHNTFYECSQVGSCRRHVDSGGTTQSIGFGARHSTRTTTDAPIVLDPSNHNVVYFAGNVLDRSTDQGVTFTQISPPGDYLTGPVPPDENDQGPFYANEYATITWIAPAKTDPNTIYLGTDTGRLWKTTDLGVSWTEFAGKGLPVRWVNSIVVDPTNADHVFVAYSGYREGDLSSNVWETTDGGQSWANISGTLPNGPVEMLAYDQARQQLYAATDLGVFYDKNSNKNWKRLGHALPASPVLDIKITGDGTTIYAATFGRSVWRMPLPSS